MNKSFKISLLLIWLSVCTVGMIRLQRQNSKLTAFSFNDDDTNPLVVDNATFEENYNYNDTMEDIIPNEISDQKSEPLFNRILNIKDLYDLFDSKTMQLLATTSLGKQYGGTPWAMFDGFKTKFGKTYPNEMEELKRFKIFFRNAKNIALHNMMHAGGHVGYNLDFNNFADWTHQEFQKLNGLKPDLSRRSKDNSFLPNKTGKKDSSLNFLDVYEDNIPSEFDWRAHGAVTPVKAQGHCGSCWAFSATGALEAQNFLKSGRKKLVSLSEQNLVDCSGKYGNHGCWGGFMDNAFEYIKYNGGIDTEISYPYRAKDGKKCLYNRKKVGAYDWGYADLPQSERMLKIAIALVGPVSVGMDASPDDFQFYKSGVYESKDCSRDMLNHGVLAVGYGSQENGQKYWLIKNSWGTNWGEQGYFKLARDKNFTCGIATLSNLPVEKSLI